MLDRRSSIYLSLFLFFSSLAISSTCATAADDASVARAVGKIKVKTLNEISGVAASRQNPDVLWVHNDHKGGDSRVVFAVHTSSSPCTKRFHRSTFSDAPDSGA